MREIHSRETLSILDIPAADDTLAGAQLGAADNNTTGKFTNQAFEVIDGIAAEADDVAAAIDKFDEQGVSLIIADLSSARLLAAADRAKTRGALIFNATATDDSLREESCRANVFHVAPTRSMLADGLTQYLVWKQWRRWLLIKGSHEEDELLAAAIRNSAKKFGAKIVEERLYTDTEGGRRSDFGQRANATSNSSPHARRGSLRRPRRRRRFPVFAGYLPYHTWDARPVAGSAGLMPVSWDVSHEQWAPCNCRTASCKPFVAK